jgi:predicted nucleic acid-binding Zn ribbon protein
MPRICVICLQEFPERGRSKTCLNIECVRTYKNRLATHVCYICRKHFQPRRRDRFLCSDLCKIEHQRRYSVKRYNKPDYPPKPCSVCGKSFKPHYVNSSTCSKKCYQAKRREAKRVWAKKNPDKVKAGRHKTPHVPPPKFKVIPIIKSDLQHASIEKATRLITQILENQRPYFG